MLCWLYNQIVKKTRQVFFSVRTFFLKKIQFKTQVKHRLINQGHEEGITFFPLYERRQ